MLQRFVLVAGLGLAALGAFGTFALADDGSVMERLMGHDAYAAMVSHMRGVLGDERANAMLAHCESAMASTSMDAGSMSGMMSGMSGMMSGMRGMMGGGR